MTKTGMHISLNFQGCNKEFMADKEQIRSLLCSMAKKTQEKIICTCVCAFPSSGISGAFSANHGHVSVHTYPHLEQIHVDVFASKAQPMFKKAIDHLTSFIECDSYKTSISVNEQYESILH